MAVKIAETDEITEIGNKLLQTAKRKEIGTRNILFMTDNNP